MLGDYKAVEPERAARIIADAAYRSLILEVCTTPKPGLVDRRNNGAHKDMDLPMFRRSAAALRPYFLACAEAGMHYRGPAALVRIVKLVPLGLEAEQTMYRVTSGVNTHKGAIFSLGVFCGAAGYLIQEPDIRYLSSIARWSCALMLQDLERADPAELAKTHGGQLFLRHGVLGIRGEAAKGYPTVYEIAMPAYLRYRAEGLPRMEAGACTLLHLISTVEDTNLIARSDYQTYVSILRETSRFLRTASSADILAVLPEMDDIFIKKNLSPGGSADLLAVTYFLDLLAPQLPGLHIRKRSPRD